MPNCHLVTIWHTGSRYFKKALETKYRVSFSHYNDTSLQQLLKAENAYTCYRDPLKVAASWVNRGRTNNHTYMQNWMTQWQCFEKAIKSDRVKVLDLSKGDQHGLKLDGQVIGSKEDRLGLHEAIANGDLDYYYSHVPKWMIDYATDKSEYYVAR